MKDPARPRPADRTACPRVAAMLAVACHAALAQQPAPQIHGPFGDTREAFQWLNDELDLIPGVRRGVSSRTIVGATRDPGIYLIRVRLEPGAVIPPHTHPDARVTTVLSGRLYYGLGAVADPAHAKSFGPGSVYFTPADTAHFLIAGDEPAIYQEVGYGPSRSEPLAHAP